jgi:hypothetical protein
MELSNESLENMLNEVEREITWHLPFILDSVLIKMQASQCMTLGVAVGICKRAQQSKKPLSEKQLEILLKITWSDGKLITSIFESLAFPIILAVATPYSAKACRLLKIFEEHGINMDQKDPLLLASCLYGRLCKYPISGNVRDRVKNIMDQYFPSTLEAL